MSREVLDAVERLRISTNAAKDSAEVSNDERLHESRPRKRQRPSAGELKAQLEADFLNPSTTFEPEWLNKLQ